MGEYQGIGVYCVHARGGHRTLLTVTAAAVFTVFLPNLLRSIRVVALPYFCLASKRIVVEFAPFPPEYAVSEQFDTGGDGQGDVVWLMSREFQHETGTTFELRAERILAGHTR